jgi:hypothetical protein
MNQLSNRESNSEPQTDFALQGQVYGELMAILSKVANKERLAMLKAVAGSFGHRVLPGLGTQGPQGYGVPRIGQKLKAPAQLKSRKPAKQREIEAQIKVCNTSISAESSRVGQRLTEDHPLIQERLQLFRSLQENKVGDQPSQSEGCNPHP